MLVKEFHNKDKQPWRFLKEINVLIMKNILLFGASDHARYTIDIVEKEGKYKIVGILDKNLEKNTFFEGYPVLGYLDDLKEIIRLHDPHGGIVAIGDNYSRKKVVEHILELNSGFSFVNAIHPSAIIGKNVKIGNGCVFMAGTIVNNDTNIGSHCFIATKASLDHDCILGDFSSLSPGVTTGGRVHIGSETAVGIGVNILHYKKVGNQSVIGAGTLVTKDVGDNVVVYGFPGKVVRNREASDRYL